MHQAVSSYVNATRAELVTLCARLVAARSANPPGDTTRVADAIVDYLRAHGLEDELPVSHLVVVVVFECILMEAMRSRLIGHGAISPAVSGNSMSPP